MLRFLTGTLLLSAMSVFALGVSSQPPPGKDGKKDGPPGGRPPRYQPGSLFPPHVKNDLQLTKDQEQQISDLEKEVRTKLEKILTAEQMKQLIDHRPPPPPPPPGTSDAGDHGRPVAQVAQELGVTPEQFREAFKKVRPAPAGQEPTEEQRRTNRKVLSEALGVDPERLDMVMDKYRPGGRGTNGGRAK